MLLAKVVGPVVATIKHPSLQKRIIYVVQPVDKNNKAIGKSLLAVDSVQSRIGDIVLVHREGNGCREILNIPEAPVNAVIVGIVDV